MKDSPALHIKTYLLLLVMVLFAPLGNVLLSKGMKGVGAATDWRPADLSHVLMRISGSGFIWLGIASLLTFFVAYMLVLTWADYSYVQPASAFSYAVVAILSYIILDESVSPLRWAGIAVICIGVLVVGRTPHRTTLERTGA
ncbi:MAG TPA: EamA family transporter [Candidatus Dormibacteraeota bacterium]|nr:EamA family transporter [Candidatus Dormibacteraeota bacterium]